MFKINLPIGDGYNSNPEEVKLLRKILHKLGYEDENTDFVFFDKALNKNIRDFQKDQKLKVDGYLLPNGETERTIRLSVRSPKMTCTNCGAPHGGSKGDIRPYCDLKR